MSWRYTFWACRQLDAELFEPVDENEMFWVEDELNDGTNADINWHVYGHRELYGPHAWHSGASLDQFGNDLMHLNLAEEPKCHTAEGTQVYEHVFPLECALLRFNNPRFELSYSSCLHVDRRQTNMGFICKRELRRTSHTSINVLLEEHRTESEWIAPTHKITIFTNKYTISENDSDLSWYEAMQKCREKDGELPTIESVAEISWIREQWLLRSHRNESNDPHVFIIYVNLHKWLYNPEAWGWSSGAPLNTSVINFQSGNFCTDSE